MSASQEDFSVLRAVDTLICSLTLAPTDFFFWGPLLALGGWGEVARLLDFIFCLVVVATRTLL